MFQPLLLNLFGCAGSIIGRSPTEKGKKRTLFLLILYVATFREELFLNNVKITFLKENNTVLSYIVLRTSETKDLVPKLIICPVAFGRYWILS